MTQSALRNHLLQSKWISARPETAIFLKTQQSKRREGAPDLSLAPQASSPGLAPVTAPTSHSRSQRVLLPVNRRFPRHSRTPSPRETKKNQTRDTAMSIKVPRPEQVAGGDGRFHSYQSLLRPLPRSWSSDGCRRATRKRVHDWWRWTAGSPSGSTGPSFPHPRPLLAPSTSPPARGKTEPSVPATIRFKRRTTCPPPTVDLLKPV